STVFAVKKVAHRLAAGFVRLFLAFALVGVHAALGYGFGGFSFAAGRATVREAWLIRLQLEVLGADGTDFDGKRHPIIMQQTGGNFPRPRRSGTRSVRADGFFASFAAFLSELRG